MQNLINKIEKLEAKRDNGTITMTEEAVMIKLIELVEGLLNKK